jgi:hypothetical protein
MFPVVTAILNDRDGTFYRRIEMSRFWVAPPKILIEDDDYYIRITNDEIIEEAVYRRTQAVRHIERRVGPNLLHSVDREE